MAKKTLQRKSKKERLIRLVGKNNTFIIKGMQDIDFGSVHDVRIQPGSALPATLSGKMSYLLDIMSMNPNEPVLSNQELLQALEMPNDSSLRDKTQGALLKSQENIRRIVNEQPPLKTGNADNLWVHYETIMEIFQGNKIESMSEKSKKLLEVYGKRVEDLMYQKALANPKFAAKLAEEELYPAFFKPTGPSISKILAGHAMDSGRVNSSAEQPTKPEKAKQITENAKVS